MEPEPYPHLPPSSDELVVDDGEPMETARHSQQMMILIQSLEDAWRGRDDFYVGGNMFLYFSETQARRNDFRGPDVFVVLNTTRRERKAWVVWEEDGKTPDVIIELLFDRTEKVDRGEKMRIYAARLKVGEYFLFDPFSGLLEGYELDVLHGAYVPKKPTAQGRLRCEQMGLYRPPHDHGRAWVVYAVQSGALEIGTYAGVADGDGHRLVRRDTSLLRPGEARAYLPGDIHDTHCVTEDALVLRFTERDLRHEDQVERMVTRFVDQDGEWFAPHRPA